MSVGGKREKNIRFRFEGIIVEALRRFLLSPPTGYQVSPGALFVDANAEVL